MDREVDLQGFFSEQTRNNVFVLIGEVDVVESEIVRNYSMKRARLVIRGVKEEQDEASGMVVTRSR